MPKNDFGEISRILPDNFKTLIGVPLPHDEDLAHIFLVKEPVAIEEWEKNLGPGQFIRYLRFENGRLIRISAGDYGY